MISTTYLPTNEVSESFGRLIEALDKEAFDTLLDAIPPAIADAEPASFETFDGVPAAELAKRAGLSA